MIDTTSVIRPVQTLVYEEARVQTVLCRDGTVDSFGEILIEFLGTFIPSMKRNISVY